MEMRRRKWMGESSGEECFKQRWRVCMKEREREREKKSEVDTNNLAVVERKI